MADCSATKSIQKRQSNGDNDVPCKRQTPKINGKTDVPLKTLQLIDVNNDCLRAIFNHLNLIDLLNVADTSKRLKQIAEMEFERKYKTNQVHFAHVRPNPNRCVTVNGYRIVIGDLKTCLQLLRCFGHIVNEIELNFGNIEAKFSAEIERCLAEFCSQSLLFLSMFDNKSGHLIFDAVEKSFMKIISLHLENCHIGAKTSLTKLFPNMTNLYLHSNFYENPAILQENFPFLFIFSTENLNESNIREILRLNPQLEKLYIHSNYSPELIRYANENLPKLEDLHLFDLPDGFLCDNLDVIHLNNIKNFTLDTNNSYFAPAMNLVLDSLPFSFGKLKKLCVVNLTLNPKTLHSLAKINDLEILKLKKWKDEGSFVEKLLQLANLLATVEELDLGYCGRIDVEWIVWFLRQSKSIVKFTLPTSGEIKNEIDMKMGREWNVEQHYKFAVITSSKRSLTL